MSTMYRSRATLARIEAAAMEALFWSPFTTVWLGTEMPVDRLPSMRARLGTLARPWMARSMASIRALRMLIWSISSGSAQATAQASACWQMRS